MIGLQLQHSRLNNVLIDEGCHFPNILNPTVHIPTSCSFPTVNLSMFVRQLIFRVF